jgi:hypothetical protein
VRALPWIAVGMLSLVLVGVLAVGGVLLWATGGPVGLLARELPSDGAIEIGVDYRATIDCLLQFRVGKAPWRLDSHAGWPPPEEWPGIRDASTWTVPGTVRFSSYNTAVFRAQTDGSEWTAAPAFGPLSGGLCI